MQTLDLSFIDKANGRRMILGLQELARIFKFDLADLKKSAGFSDSTFSRWFTRKRTPRRSSRLKIKEYVRGKVSG